jgi:hypothetical protein
MSGLTDEDIRNMGAGMTGTELAELWILDRRQDTVGERLDRLETAVRDRQPEPSS